MTDAQHPIAPTEALQDILDNHWRRLPDVLREQLESLPDAQLRIAWRCLALSDWVAESAISRPDQFSELLRSGDLERPYPSGIYNAKALSLGAVKEEDELRAALRHWRRREMVRIAWRDLGGLAGLDETLAELSDFADAAVAVAVDWLYRACCARWGTPLGASSGAPQGMVVVAMGKLGGRELNFSSDIDLIFAFEEGGETDAERPLENSVFFTRLGQRVIKMLDETTVDGQVFRVDMRLRPYGQSGALVPKFAALEAYYQDQGRMWERYAMVKARVIAGPAPAAQRLREILHPFVYRRYLDFSVVQALRELKSMINREVRQRGLEDNLKLGAGGIREVEFVAQALQLIHGGRDAALQQAPLLVALGQLAAHGHLPAAAVDELRAGYCFLRRAEHHLQEQADAQTQQLPADDLGRTRLAIAMGFANWGDFKAELAQHRARVEHHFHAVVSDPEPALASPGRQATRVGHNLWPLAPARDALQRALAELGLAEPDAFAERLHRFAAQPRVADMQTEGRERLDRLMPVLLDVLLEQARPLQALERALPVIQAVVRRSVYLVLLLENTEALRHLVPLVGLSPWIAETIASHPSLLDEFVDAQALYAPPERKALQQELNLRLLRVPEDDLEQQMEGLRYFKNAHVLRVAAAEVAERVPLMRVSDYLTWIAEAVLVQVLGLAWRDLTRKYGSPQRAPGVAADSDFIVVAYGKFGGIELSYGSDLDLVFIYEAPQQFATDGDRSIDNPVFYTRLAQRMLHVLGARTPSGQLYEVDMRLRPSGRAGLLVTTLEGFARYQREDAWTWEQQALVRARVVAGAHGLRARFEQARAEVLGVRRDPAALATEVCAMRKRMLRELASGSSDRFHLKHDPGGIVDIEFMVQYAVLAWSWQEPKLLQFTDNMRLLDVLAETALLPPEHARCLQSVYQRLRADIHRLALMNVSVLVEAADYVEDRQSVRDIWEQLFGAT
ncbi:MAG: bifunctional [glutamate--ammonia ligase]-adenylyl-L-tyrosine phosphorylase/[glutamate--ammonia-ligase] adenylyltransferase [Pseudomonadota bacterium]|nr:bifunctional [glutamate--ammonia ligase]-adenylyl-L-tyrosine phosphorylase/[glutamate--ammonia-ligase] adenylyltransferase [Pseudomonadota bacterium]